MPTTRGPGRTPTLIVALLLGLASTLGPGAGRAEGALGGRSSDISGHWAATYITVLREENVITPWAGPLDPAPDGRQRAWLFLPDASVAPADFGTWLVNVHPGEGLFPPPAVAVALAGSGRPELAFRSSQASASAWAAPASAGRPAPVLLRQDAVAVLVEALGLADFARRMDAELAATYLRQFRDGSSIPPGHRQLLALAVRLGIIEGYPDRTLRPRQAMTRAEGATVIYRCCLLLAEADPNPFSPDGDGVEDVTLFRLGSLRNRNARGWGLTVYDAAGEPRRSVGSAPNGPPPQALTWDGTDERGIVLTPGIYYYRGWLRDRNGLVHLSTLKPVEIEEKWLRGSVHPVLVLPGETVRLAAAAGGAPARVSAALSSFPAAGPVELEPGGGRREWAASFRVPDSSPPGPCLVTFTAHYRAGSRTATATFEVGSLAVSGTLRPNPAGGGQVVRVTASTNLPARSAEAAFHLPGGILTTALVPARPEGLDRDFAGQVPLPPDTPEGRYPVTLLAARGALTARATLWLDVTESGGGLVFFLSG